MTPEETARKHERLTGFDLVDYAEIALPLWQLSVETLSLAHRRFQPIVEYVLRAANFSLSLEEIAGLLGLELDVVRGAIAQLVGDRLLAIRDGVPALTELGQRALTDEGIQIPIQEQLPIVFDGLTRKPVLNEPEEVVLVREIEDGAVVEIPSIPTSRPGISELNFADVVHYVSRQSGGRREMGRDILRFKRISRCRRISRRAVGLVFKARKGKELRVLFVVEGVIDEQLQNRFAAGGGTTRPWFVRAFSDAYVAANLRRHLGQEAGRIPVDSADYERRQQKLSLAKLKRLSLERKMELIRSGALPTSEMPSNEALESAQKEEKESLNALTEAPVRPAAVYECLEKLHAGTKSAVSSISISSRGLAPHIVDNRFLELLKAAALRGVQITITLHEDSREWPKRGAAWARCYSEINTLCREYPKFIRVTYSRQDRFVYITWDDRVLLVCNRPLLSNHGRVKSFEQFAGFVIQRSDLIRAYVQRVANIP